MKYNPLQSRRLPLSNFSALWDRSNFSIFNLFENLFILWRVLPSVFFYFFCNRMEFKKAQWVHSFTILKTLRFLSLRYSANFGRFRFVYFLVLSYMWKGTVRSKTVRLQREWCPRVQRANFITERWESAESLQAAEPPCSVGNSSVYNNR